MNIRFILKKCKNSEDKEFVFLVGQFYYNDNWLDFSSSYYFDKEKLKSEYASLIKDDLPYVVIDTLKYNL